MTIRIIADTQETRLDYTIKDGKNMIWPDLLSHFKDVILGLGYIIDPTKDLEFISEEEAQVLDRYRQMSDLNE